MSLILNIDTATARASVSLAAEGVVIAALVNEQSMDHAAWIHTAIKDLTSINNHAYTLKDINAVANVSGPGSYTGLRVGMSTAKELVNVTDPAFNGPFICTALAVVTVMLEESVTVGELISKLSPASAVIPVPPV